MKRVIRPDSENPGGRPTRRSESLGESGADHDRRKQLQKKVLATVVRFGACPRLTREQVHDRNVR